MEKENVFTENGAVSYDTFGSEILNQFGKSGNYRNRDIETVWNEQDLLWNEDSTIALRFPFYLRLITRKITFDNGSKTEKMQKGMGLRDESFKRLLWIACYHDDEFYKNIHLLPLFGSWKDLWKLMYLSETIDFPCNFELCNEMLFMVLISGLSCDETCDLVKKYMPEIRSNSKCKTEEAIIMNKLAKQFSSFLGLSYKEYRKLKVSGKAHDFQKAISIKDYSKINWSCVPGKALNNLANSKFMQNKDVVDSYISWIDKQDTVKFNGYPHELLHKYNNSNKNIVSKITANKQFDNLVKKNLEDGGSIHGNILCALDTSGSMTCNIPGTEITAFDVCISLGLYFSEMNKGAFHNVVAMFDDVSKLLKLEGTFTEKVDTIMSEEIAWGSTNFQSLIDLLVNTRENKSEIPLADYPSTLLVVSDMQFNPLEDEKTNYQKSMDKIRKAFGDEFADNFKIIWWNVKSANSGEFPSTMENSGTYLFSGYDPSIISLLLGEDVKEKVNCDGNKIHKSMDEIVYEALTQEVFKYIK